MSHGEMHSPLFREEVKEDHRVDAAAYRDHDGILFSEQSVCAAEFPESWKKVFGESMAAPSDRGSGRGIRTPDTWIMIPLL